MPKKHTIDELKNIIKDKFHDDVELLSTEYINNKTPLLFKCKCGNTFETSWNILQNGFIRCKECQRKYKSNINPRKFTLNQVIDCIEKQNCKYISGNYENNRSKLIIQCQCGNIYERTFEHFQRGQIYCEECINKKQSCLWRKPFDVILKQIQDRGCEYISGEYINSSSKLLLKCSCGNIFEKSMNKFLNGQNHCPECGNKNLSVSKRKYKIEESPSMLVSPILRLKMNPWRKLVLDAYNNTCPITKSTTNLDVHHLVSFSSILQSVLIENGYNIGLYDNITIFKTKEEFDDILSKLLDAHSVNIGIVISNDIHIHFHKEYGYHNNTPEQFDEFLQYFYHLHLSDIQIL